MACVACGGPREVGALCRACASSVPKCEGFLPEHVTTRVAAKTADGWLLDAYGGPHPLSAYRTTVGRQASVDVAVLHNSVSRHHAQLARVEGSWQIRDMGSRNGTFVDGRPIQGRQALPEHAKVRFGDVTFLFAGRVLAVPATAAPSVITAYGAGHETARFVLHGPEVELCLLASDGAPGGGALLYRSPTVAAWAEMSLPPLEFQLLRTLCARAVEERRSPATSRGCVATRQLARQLPFQSRYANEENVRQVVRRVRTTLHEIGADGVVEAVPGRGYYVSWPVAAS